MSTTVAFTGWNSIQSGWNTSTWDTSLPFSLTATGSVGLAALEGDGIVAVTGVAGTAALGNIFSTNIGISATGAVGSATIIGKANVSVTGVAGTTALGGFFTTNTMTDVKMIASVNGATAVTVGNANVPVTGVSATGLVTSIEEFPIVWGQIIPSQNSNFSAISPSQTPSWIDVAA